MNNGTNDYGAFKSLSEEIVSRTLQANYRSYSNIIWRTGKPALDAEWNLLNDMSMEVLSGIIRTSCPSGWLTLGKNAYLDTNCGYSNRVIFFAQENEQETVSPNALVNGWPIHVAGTLNTGTIYNYIELPAAGSSARWDFVFLEVWRAQLRCRDVNNQPISQNKPSTEYIYKFGNVQFTGDQYVDDTIDTVFDAETSERVQVQYRIRVVPNVSFPNTDSLGFDDTTVRGQGASTSPQIAGYNFTNMYQELGDQGLWRAGSGNDASRSALQSVDGYTYAIPMFKIYRRHTTSWQDTDISEIQALYGQQGNSATLLSAISDRPDGKFHDGIEDDDIIDLRAKVSLTGWDFKNIIEVNVHKLLEGALRTNATRQIFYNLISDNPLYGYTRTSNDVGASGKRTYWSDAVTLQSNVFANVTTTTTSVLLDVFRGSGSGSWAIGNSIVIRTLNQKLPTGTIIKGTPRIYLEDEAKTPISGSWTGLNTNQVTFSMSSGIWIGTSFDIWVYYDLELPAYQGLSNVEDELLRVVYSNAISFPSSSGTVVRGTNIKTETMRYQDVLQHPCGSYDDTTNYAEIESVKQRRQIKISPLVQTTTVKNGLTRTLEVETLNASTKTITVPFPLQHLKGVYTSSTGGTEIAMQHIADLQISSVETDRLLICTEYFIGELTSLKYIPTGPGSEIELLGSTYSGAPLSYVLEHRAKTTETTGTRVMLYNTNGIKWPIPVGATASQFKWSGTRTKIRLSAGAGYDLNGLVIDCTESTNTGHFSTMSNRDKVWIDCDYFAPPHNGAQIRIMYSYTPYQGSTVGGQNFTMLRKRDMGLFFNNGTGGGTISMTSTGTSPIAYSPVSPKLPGYKNQDHLRDGTVISLRSAVRYTSDFWSTANFDIYGYHGGGLLRPDSIYEFPTTTNTTYRGFSGSPMLPIIFELPAVDTTYAEFVLPFLVRNKNTGHLYLMIQIGNKGVHTSDSTIFVDFFNLNERILTNNCTDFS